MEDKNNPEWVDILIKLEDDCGERPHNLDKIHETSNSN